MPKEAADFKRKLKELLAAGSERGLTSLTISSGELHRLVGDYPGHNHRMPVCCKMMKELMSKGDMIIRQPPKGQGSTLEIRYLLPRQTT